MKKEKFLLMVLSHLYKTGVFCAHNQLFEEFKDLPFGEIHGANLSWEPLKGNTRGLGESSSFLQVAGKIKYSCCGSMSGFLLRKYKNIYEYQASW